MKKLCLLDGKVMAAKQTARQKPYRCSPNKERNKEIQPTWVFDASNQIVHFPGIDFVHNTVICLSNSDDSVGSLSEYLWIGVLKWYAIQCTHVYKR